MHLWIICFFLTFNTFDLTLDALPEGSPISPRISISSQGCTTTPWFHKLLYYIIYYKLGVLHWGDPAGLERGLSPFPCHLPSASGRPSPSAMRRYRNINHLKLLSCHNHSEFLQVDIENNVYTSINQKDIMWGVGIQVVILFFMWYLKVNNEKTVSPLESSS